MRKIFLSVFAIAIISCTGTKEDESQTPELGKYVYEDDNAVIHVGEYCEKLLDGYNDKGHKIYAKKPIDTLEIYQVNRVCTSCVGQENYKTLREIADKNIKHLKYRQKIHKELSEIFCDIPDYDDFERNIKTNAAFRRELYDIVKSEGIDVKDSYQDFSWALGYDPWEHARKIKWDNDDEKK